MNKLSSSKRAQIITALIEGNSIASTCRMLSVAKMTVLSLLREVGEACLRFHDAQVRGLSTTDVQCDRNLVVLLLESEERPGTPSGPTGIRFGLDMDRARFRFEDDDLVGRE